MILQYALFIGAFFRWIIKGFRTKLKDEISGNYKGVILKNYDLESIIIGYVIVILFLFLIITFLL